MSRMFRKPRAPLAADKGIRQGRAVNAARAAFGDTNRVLAFLNSEHEDLGGRPLDLALASAAGLAAVEAAIAEEAARPALRAEPPAEPRP